MVEKKLFRHILLAKKAKAERKGQNHQKDAHAVRAWSSDRSRLRTEPSPWNKNTQDLFGNDTNGFKWVMLNMPNLDCNTIWRVLSATLTQCATIFYGHKANMQFWWVITHHFGDLNLCMHNEGMLSMATTVQKCKSTLSLENDVERPAKENNVQC